MARTRGFRAALVAATVASAATVAVVGPHVASAGTQTCSDWHGELLPNSSACLDSLNLALRPAGYVLRFERGDVPDEYRQHVAEVAQELSVITSLPFSVGTDVDRGAAPAVGEIIFRLHKPRSACHGGSACAAGRRFGFWPWLSGNDEIQGGQVYLTVNIDRDPPATRKAAILHEVGHVLGLQHYDYIDEVQPSREIMAWNVRSTGVVEWQPGDIAGLKYLADYHRRSPSGSVTAITTYPSAFVVAGEMVDPSSPANHSIAVRIDDGKPTPGSFGDSFSAAPGEHRVCVELVNVGAGVDTAVGCRNIFVPSSPSTWVLRPIAD